MRDQLDKLVQEMLDRGILYDDARREFEKMFITRALQRSKGSVGDAAELLGLHRNTVARKMAEYRIKRYLTLARGSWLVTRFAERATSYEQRKRLAVPPPDCLTSAAALIELAVGPADC